MRLGSLCSGYGGLEIGVAEVLPVEPLWVADPDPGAAAILAHHWPDVPNLGDITRINWAQVPPVDILCAGFPCQDVSLAGLKKGMGAETRSGIWSHVAAAIATLRPQLVYIENVGGLRHAKADDSDMEPCPVCMGGPGDWPRVRALGAVLASLAEIRYDAEWTSVRAADIGAPHRRERLFILAWPRESATDT
ncbi:DNA cytosine methyltransferase [Actinomadura sp. NEAU-AAG7]|uniref:DNA cytosine methyltransferase n=1 Tax=Actinomadura sp. NEAU-AAG7 TaxID=2839640 RepID=UPI0035B281AA